MKNIMTILFISAVMFSCSNSEKKRLAEEKTKNLFAAIKEKDETKMKELFSDIAVYSTYRLSDSIAILNTEVKDSIICVSVQNYFTNGFGKNHNSSISLVFDVDSVNLIETYNLTSFTDNDIYKFGINTGCIIESEANTDYEKSLACQKSEFFLDKLKEKTVSFIESNLIISDFQWETGYSNSASGRAIVKNYTTFNIPDLQFNIVYKTRSGKYVTEDNGYITYDALEAYSSKSFSFYTEYVGNASNATISIKFDDKLAEEYLLAKKWEGNEFSLYEEKDSLVID